MRDVDEVRRVHSFQRRREGEGRLRGGLAPEREQLVHILPEGRNRQDCATDTQTRETTPPLGSA